MATNKTKQIKALSDLTPDPANVNKGTERGAHQLDWSLTELGAGRSILADADGVVIAGNKTLETAAKHEMPVRVIETNGGEIVVVQRTDLRLRGKGAEATKARQLAIADNRISETNYTPDIEQLLEHQAAGVDLSPLYLQDELDAMMASLTPPNLEGQGEASDAAANGEQSKATLADRFLVPPFSVLDARQGYWQDRKRVWLALGIQSELGRGGELHSGSTVDARNGDTWEGGRSAWQNESTSIFDPVLCELAYRWFSGEGATILDPFAGGSVRGIVAAKLNRKYTGCDLRAEQITANIEQAQKITPQNMPRWITGDSREIQKHAAGEYDLLFSCPPYADLEVYSENPKDLSTMSYADFIKAYSEIIFQSVAMLKSDRFACFVVGDIRDKKGFYRNFVSDTIQCFEGAGARLYNEAILVTSVGSLPIRVGRQFEAGRKLGKTHQNVLVFIKGDPKKAVANCGKVEVYDPAEDFGEVVKVDE